MDYSSEIGMNMYLTATTGGDCVEGVRKRRMKDEQEEEKQMDPPPFPRLHINDANKRGGGGPRAPPRNKMALYEQLSTHSPKAASPSVSMWPLPPADNSGTTILVPSPFSNHDGTHLYESLHSYHSRGGLNLNSTPTLGQHSKEYTSYQTSNAMWHLKPTAECELFRPLNFSNTKNSCLKNLGDEDDYQVLASARSPGTPNYRNNQENTHRAKIASSRLNACGQPVTAFEKQLKQTGTTDLNKSRQHHQTEENKTQSLNPKRRSLVDYITRLGDSNTQLHQEYSVLKESKSLTDGAITEPKSAARKRTMDDLSDVMPSLGDNHTDRNGEIIKLRVMNSTLGLDISPEGVLGVMGQKQFWNTRSTIVHQQRVFAVQVFELHRLTKVQRLIAGSPELMLEGSFYLGKPSNKLSLTKLPYEIVLEQPPLIPKPYEDLLEPPPLIPEPKIDYEIPKPSNDCTSESAVTKIPLLSLKNDTNKRITRQSDQNPYTGTQPPATTATDAKSDNKPCNRTQPAFATTEANLQPLCFHPPHGNQCLVPVRSPSEGLVYKPYTGVCPPTAGLMGPVYGSCGPMALTPVVGDFFTPTYGGILSGTPLSRTFFLGPHMVPFPIAESNGMDNQLSIQEVNFTVPYQSSCNMLRHKSKESELQGSTASSPTERDALPLFPIAPAVQVPDQPAKTHSTEKQVRVIKVVPHNPKSASESVARIFQSIQEERRVYD